MLRQWHCRSRGLVPAINIKHVSRPPLLVGGFFVCGGIVRAWWAIPLSARMSTRKEVQLSPRLNVLLVLQHLQRYNNIRLWVAPFLLGSLMNNAERRWLIVMIQLATMQRLIAAKQLHTVGTGRISPH
jgi:hypothetical protein